MITNVRKQEEEKKKLFEIIPCSRVTINITYHKSNSLNKTNTQRFVNANLNYT